MQSYSALHGLFVIEGTGTDGILSHQLVSLRGRPLDREVSEMRLTQPYMARGPHCALGRVCMTHRPPTTAGDSLRKPMRDKQICLHSLGVCGGTK